jgi:hypothetical protein
MHHIGSELILFVAVAVTGPAIASPATQGGVTPSRSMLSTPILVVARCRRACVKTRNLGPATAPQCIEWRTLCTPSMAATSKKPLPHALNPQPLPPGRY